MRINTVSVDELAHRLARRIRLLGNAARLRFDHRHLRDSDESAEQHKVSEDV